MLAPYVNDAFPSPATTSFIGLLVGVWAFAFQIYGDFSGYSDIARGSAYLLGIDLPENFNQPYFSRSVTEFWRRWHISLSTWLRDYLYIPLGGNRGGEGRTYRNLLLTMLIGGLWHGAATTFVIWGGLHGLYLIGERRFTSPWPRRTTAGPGCCAATWCEPCVTFQLVCLAWVFFRAPSTYRRPALPEPHRPPAGGHDRPHRHVMLALAAGPPCSSSTTCSSGPATTPRSSPGTHGAGPDVRRHGRAHRHLQRGHPGPVHLLPVLSYRYSSVSGAFGPGCSTRGRWGGGG